MRPDIKSLLRELLVEIYQVSNTLFRIMIPVLLAVKLLEELGAIVYFSRLLEPVMSLVGLPESMGLVWAATLLSNIYAGMIIFFSLSPQESMTVAQVTVLGTMMLVAHTLPVEGRIAQKAGVRLGFTLILRIGGALLLGFLLDRLYTWGGWLQQPSLLFWQPQEIDPSLAGWAVEQLKNLGMVVLIIALLLSLLKILRIAGIERLLIRLLQPLLRLLGIGGSATTITVIGMTLGLSFGGGLLIREVQAGHVPYRDVFSAMSLLALCHSLIEDTLLVMVMGGHLSGILWLRMLFSFVVVVLLTRLVERTGDRFHRRYLVHSLPER